MFDYGPPPKIWLPPRPAIIRPAEKKLLRPQQANILPGWFPFMAAPEGGLASITQVGSSTSTAATITLPADIQAGDLIVILDGANSAFATPAAVTPTDFTNHANNTVTPPYEGYRLMLSSKLAVGTEGSASITGMNGNAGNTKACYVFRGDIPATSRTPSTFNGEGTTGDPAAQNVAASGGSAPLVVLAGYFARSGPVDPRTFSPAKDGEINAGSGVLYLAYKIYNSSPADVSVDMDDEVTNLLQSGYIEMAA
jgi:hypothetical protein